MNAEPQMLDLFEHADLATITALAGESLEVYCKTFRKGTFTRPLSRLHKRFCGLLDRRDRRKKNAKAARSFGKTTYVLARAEQAILYEHAHFICYITNTLPRAIMRCENMKRNLTRNRLIRQLWPNLKTNLAEEVSRGDGLEEEFSKNAWVAFGRTVVVPMGFGQTPRGLLWRDFRPDLIIIDDAQKRERLMNEEFRQDDYEWLRGDVEEAVNLYDENWEIIHVDTVKHRECFTEKLAALPDWESVTFPIGEFRDDVLYSTIPELVSDEKIREQYESHKEDGTLDVFYREKLCRAMADENLVFRPEYFQYVDEMQAEITRNWREMDSVVIVDPARSKNPAACESGVVGWTIDRFKPALYLRRAIGKRLHPDETADLAIDTALSIGAHTIGVEVTGLGEYATYPYENRIHQRGLNIRVYPLHAKGGVTEPGKIARIKALLPFYRRKEVYHVKGQTGRYEQQLLSFPEARFWDLMDAAAYIVEIMNEGDWFFMPPEFDKWTDHQAAAKEWREIQDRDRDEYEPLCWGCV